MNGQQESARLLAAPGESVGKTRAAGPVRSGAPGKDQGVLGFGWGWPGECSGGRPACK